MKLKRIRITFESPNMSVEFNSPDGHLLDWNAMSRNEQIKALNGLANAYHLFKRNLKNE